MKIAYLYQPGRLVRLPGVRKGEVPSEFFYGAPELERSGHEVKYLEVHEVAAEAPLRIVLETVTSKKYLPAKVHFALLDGVKNVLPELDGVDVVVATTPGIAFSLGIWRQLRRGGGSEPQLVAIHCGILNYPQGRIRRSWSRRLLQEMWTMLYGEGEQEPMDASFDIPPERLFVNCFGVDEQFWKPDESVEKGNFILSIGNDSNRDYSVLLAAAPLIGQKIKIITRQVLPNELPPNVELLHGSWHTQQLDDSGLRDLYRKAACVVIPLKDSIQPSGQSVALQAMACGTPVILTKTRGLWGEDGLRQKKNILFVAPDSPEDIARSVGLLLNDSELHQTIGVQGREYVLQHGKISQFADRMESYCQRALENE